MAWPNVYSLESRHFDGSRTSQATRPTIALVHDAFHSAQHLEQLGSVLRAGGWRVLIPQMPSSGTNNIRNALEADVRSIYDPVEAEINHGRDAVLVLHGYAGLPGSVAAERLNQHSFSRPRTGFVVKLVFVAALVASESESYRDIYEPSWLLQEAGYLGVQKMNEVFFNDCPIEVARSAMAVMRPQLAETFETRVANPGWRHIECAYVVCALDNAVLPRWQLACVRKLQVHQPRAAVHSIDAGHSPFLSRIREIAAIIIGSVPTRQ